MTTSRALGTSDAWAYLARYARGLRAGIRSRSRLVMNHALKSRNAKAAELADAIEAVIACARRVVCKHQNAGGGNDYIECFNCGLMWDYRRETAEHAAMHGGAYGNRGLVAALAVPDTRPQADELARDIDEVDPHAGSTGKPSTRDASSSSSSDQDSIR